MIDGEVFTIKARKCLRCGRLLTSEDGVRIGLGCRCAEMVMLEEEERKPIEGQIGIDEWLGGKGYE